MPYTALAGLVVSLLHASIPPADAGAASSQKRTPSPQTPAATRSASREEPVPKPAPGDPPRLACTASGPSVAVVNEPASFKSQIAWPSGVPDVHPTPAVTYDWDFGDGGEHFAGAEATHVYVKPGWYAWSLTVSRANGSSCRRVWLVAVSTVSAESAAHLARSSVLSVIRAAVTPKNTRMNTNLVDAASTGRPLDVGVGETHASYEMVDPSIKLMGSIFGPKNGRVIAGHSVLPKGLAALITGTTPDAVLNLRGSVEIDNVTFSCDREGCDVLDAAGDIASTVSNLTEPDLADMATRHALPGVRLAATSRVTSQPILAELSESDASARVRIEASRRVTDPAVLARLASESRDRAVKLVAIPRVTDQTALARVAGADADAEVRLAAVQHLTDQAFLSAIAANASDAKVREAAARKVTDLPTLARLASEDKDAAVRMVAASAIADPAIAAVVLKQAGDPAVRRKVVGRVEDRAILESLADQDVDAVVRYLASGRLGRGDPKTGPFDIKFVDVAAEPPAMPTAGSPPPGTSGTRMSFQIGRAEVTQAQWKGALGTNPSEFVGDGRPVERVSWVDVQRFLAVLNGLDDGWQYSLPTERQWDHAAHAGSTAIFPSGSTKKDLKQFAWHKQNSKKATHAVERLKPNAWGLYDVAGNVSEWMQDGQAPGTAASARPPAAEPEARTKRVVRGCAWSHDDKTCTLSFRSSRTPDTRENAIGFRIVRTQTDRPAAEVGRRTLRSAWAVQP
jgi:PKD repeat protein